MPVVSTGGFGMSLTDLAPIVDLAVKMLQGAAIIVGAFWTYALFIRKREKFPKAAISQEIVQKEIDGKLFLLHITVHIENKGDVLIKLVDGEVRLLQVLPLIAHIKENVAQGKDPVQTGTEIDWYQIMKRDFKMKKEPVEIEPGESEFFFADFVVGKDIQTVQVYSYFRNELKLGNKGKAVGKALGWTCTSLYDLQNKEKEGHARPKRSQPKIRN
jgi:hypothetical protein